MGLNSILVTSPKGDNDVLMVTVLRLIKANLLLLPLPIHFWLQDRYQPLGEPLRPGEF